MTALSEKNNLRKYALITSFIVLSIAVIFFHVWNIDSLPKGLYVDEASIGQNAANIKANLQDQHGQFMPIYFEALGDFKSPIYIYTTSIVFQITGISDLSLRLTSALFFLILITGTMILVKKVFPKHPITLLYSLLALGTLPWFFTFSRIGFENIAQPALYVWALLCIYTAYQQAATKTTIYYSLAAGLLTGFAFYTSSTSRFLSFALIIGLMIVYRSKDYWKRHVLFLSAFIVSLIPYLYFSANNPGLQQKLGFISYFYASDLTLLQKLNVLIVNYLSYFDPGFLLIAGDSNLRHHTGSMGQLFLAVALLAVVGISFVIILRDSHHKYFGWLLFIGALTAPLAAAITDQSHAQLSLMFGFYILLLSVYGVAALEYLPKSSIKWASIGTLSLILIIQGAFYLTNYFTAYPTQTVAAFQSYDFNQSMDQAIAQQPQRIVISDHSNNAAAHLGFYQAKTGNQSVPTSIEVPLANPQTCILTFQDNHTINNPSQLPTVYSQANDFTKVSCF